MHRRWCTAATGVPLTVPIESDMNELRDAVGGVLGKYRLDPMNDDAKIIESVPAAYIQVVKAERAVEAAVGPWRSVTRATRCSARRCG